MKVLFQSRTTLFSVPGGDTTQVEQTAKALTRLGCEVDISLELNPATTTYDVVHLFNLSRPQETYTQALNAKRAGKKVVLSTIHLNYDEYERRARTGFAGLVARLTSNSTREYLKVCARAAKNHEWNSGVSQLLSTGYSALQVKTLKLVDAILPNSPSELDRIIRDFPFARAIPNHIVPNGVDGSLFGAANSERSEYGQYRDCILCVARIEGLKNQLNLVRAVRDLPYRLVIVGQAAPNHTTYYERVKAEATSNVVFAGRVEHDKLPSLYSEAKVHALASWMETTGLSSLEAAACGCNLVITDKGDQRSYFQNDAFYCSPESVTSIRSALLQAYREPRNERLQKRVLTKFTWEEAASQTLAAYNALFPT